MSVLSREAEEELTERMLNLVETYITKHEDRKAQSKGYLKVKDAAEYCSVSRNTLDRWVIDHGLKQSKIGQIVLYDRKDLDNFLTRFKI